MSAVAPSRDNDIEVIVLNGAPSAGKTTLAFALQEVTEDSWPVFGIDTLISAVGLPMLEMHDDAIIGARPRQHDVREGGIKFDANGDITVGTQFRRLQAAWHEGLSRMAESGTRLILDEVFLDGVHSQERLRRAFDDRRVMWVGVT